MNGRLLLVACAWSLLGCGTTAPSRDVLATSGSSSPAASTAPEALTGQIAADERVAATALRELLTNNDPELSGWAAVHTLRLGLKVDETARRSALSRCLAASNLDALLSACCWRWAGVLDVETLAAMPLPTEPAARVLAAFTLARDSRARAQLSSALALPQKIDHQAEARRASQVVALYLHLLAPLDDGPLGLALAFLEAKRSGWRDAEVIGRDTLLAQRLRTELGERLDAPGAIQGVSNIAKPEMEASVLPALLTNSMSAQPREVLRAMAMTAAPSLRREALRALVIVARQPGALDLGAAAAGLRSEDLSVRLEAARTFLVLEIRAYGQ